MAAVNLDTASSSPLSETCTVVHSDDMVDSAG